MDRPFDQVYGFLVDPANWNQWAFGLGKNLRQSSSGWVADSGGGTANVRFTPRNSFGVIDHTVTRPNGDSVYVPMRLIVNGGGCELQFTLFREPNISDSQFASDDHRNFNRHGEHFDVGETFSGVDYKTGLEAVEELRKLVPAGTSMTQFALRWILMFDAVTCAIPGGKRPDQVAENCKASDLPAFSQEVMGKVKGIYEGRVKGLVHGRW